MNNTILRKSLTAESGLAKGCLICGESVVVKDLFRINEPVICDKCKAAVMKIREEAECYDCKNCGNRNSDGCCKYSRVCVAESKNGIICSRPSHWKDK